MARYSHSVNRHWIKSDSSKSFLPAECQRSNDNLQAENTRVTSLITDIRPVVEQTQRLEEMLAMYQEQLVLMDELSEDNIRWTVSFDRFNEAVDIGGLWISAFQRDLG
jgi:hypothetical protein